MVPGHVQGVSRVPGDHPEGHGRDAVFGRLIMNTELRSSNLELAPAAKRAATWMTAFRVEWQRNVLFLDRPPLPYLHGQNQS